MIRRFGDMVAMRFGNSFTGLLQAPVQIMRQTIPNNGHSQTLHKGISPNIDIAPYQRYEGLSSIQDMNVCIVKQGMGRYREDIPDTKHPIYKHYISDIGRYEGLADIKV